MMAEPGGLPLSVSGDPYPESPPEKARTDGEGKAEAQLPLHNLKLRWQAERSCPEILPFAENLVKAVRADVDDVESQLADARDDPHKALQAQLLTMDFERAKYVLRAYLRCRVTKLDRSCLQVFSDANLFDRLSEPEQQYCERSIRLLQQHLDQSVLGKVPPQYSSMIREHETSEQPDMLPEVDLDSFVFCKANEPLHDIQLAGEDTVTLMPQELHVLHYRSVRRLAADNSIQLL